VTLLGCDVGHFWGALQDLTCADHQWISSSVKPSNNHFDPCWAVISPFISIHYPFMIYNPFKSPIHYLMLLVGMDKYIAKVFGPWTPVQSAANHWWSLLEAYPEKVTASAINGITPLNKDLLGLLTICKPWDDLPSTGPWLQTFWNLSVGFALAYVFSSLWPPCHHKSQHIVNQYTDT
jgi:hypothetical protein